MQLKGLREELVRYGKRMFESGLVVGTGGNISAFDRERGLIAITPSGRFFLHGMGSWQERMSCRRLSILRLIWNISPDFISIPSLWE